MSAAELKKELKALRKEHPDYTPVSKMKKGDVSALIQRLKAGREETPNVAATGAQEPKVATVETIQHAKESIAPVVKKQVKAKMPKVKEAGKDVVATAVAEGKKMKKVAKAGKEAPAPKGRPAKGSEEAKAHMAAIRAKKTKKDDA
jgi:hypothetical protein